MEEIKALSQDEIEEARDFMKQVLQFNYTQFEEYKKIATGRARILMNFCRVADQFPELKKQFEEKFVKVDIVKRWENYKAEKTKEMNIKLNKFIQEHYIDEVERKNVKYKKVREFETVDRNGKIEKFINIGLPYTAMGIAWIKFWWQVEIIESWNPEFYKEVKTNYWRASDVDAIASNNPKYAKF